MPSLHARDSGSGERLGPSHARSSEARAEGAPASSERAPQFKPPSPEIVQRLIAWLEEEEA
jgi:hypothetical protein